MSDGLQGLHTAHHATFGDVAGVSLPLDYGDFAGEVAAIKGAVGVLDQAGCGMLMLRGPDAPGFLSGLVTNDVQHLAPGRVQGNVISATKGRILHPLEVVRLKPDQYLLLTEPGQVEAVAGHVEAYHIREDVELGRVPLVRVDLLGPGAAGVLEALGYRSDQPFGSFHDAPLITPAYALGPLPRVLCLLPAALAQPWVEAVLGAAEDARLVGHEAYEEVRIQAGVPRFGADFDQSHLPAEAALYSHMSFTKGCYVGQEVHARLHHRGRVNQKLMGVGVPEAAAADLAPGVRLYLDGEEVGVVTSVARLPVQDERRAIAMTRFRQVQEHPPVALSSDGPAEARLYPLSTDLGVFRP